MLTVFSTRNSNPMPTNPMTPQADEALPTPYSATAPKAQLIDILADRISDGLIYGELDTHDAIVALMDKQLSHFEDHKPLAALTAARARSRELAVMLLKVLQSASPRRTEHPTMHAVWQEAHALLDDTHPNLLPEDGK